MRGTLGSQLADVVRLVLRARYMGGQRPCRRQVRPSNGQSASGSAPFLHWSEWTLWDLGGRRRDFASRISGVSPSVPGRACASQHRTQPSASPANRRWPGVPRRARAIREHLQRLIMPVGLQKTAEHLLTIDMDALGAPSDWELPCRRLLHHSCCHCGRLLWCQRVLISPLPKRRLHAEPPLSNCLPASPRHSNHPNCSCGTASRWHFSPHASRQDPVERGCNLSSRMRCSPDYCSTRASNPGCRDRCA